MNGSISLTQRQALQAQLRQMCEQQIEPLLATVEQIEEVSEIETQVATWSQEVGRIVLATVVPTLAPRYAEASLPCSCGGQAAYQRQRAAQVTTVLGPVTYRRAYYVCAACHQGWCPLDQQLGWCAGSSSRGLQARMALLAAQMPFAQVADLLRRLCGVTVSTTTCQTVAEQVGEWMHDHAHDELAELDPIRTTPVYISMDGAMTLDRADGWKEIRVGSVYTTRQTAEEIVACRHSYLVDHTSVESLGERLWEEFRRRGGKQAQQVIVIGDGALWIWNLARGYWPQAVQIVDWYHACSHLQTAAIALGEHRADAKQWYETQKTALWNGRIREVVDALHEIAWISATITDQETYFVRNQSRMDYAHYRDMGWQIGSGSIESACKRVIAARCKQAGMRWSHDGVTAIASLRAVYLSQRFDACFARCPAPVRTAHAA
jgi:uncharacterized protein UPF0236